MSTYTGRYMSSHGSTYNGVPLRVGEMTMGDHLRPFGARVALVGKTHMTADLEGFMRLGVDAKSREGVLASECGFEPYERDDGLWPTQNIPPEPAYNRYLRQHGYDEKNPWDSIANSAMRDGELLSGWLMRHAREPARVAEEHSETPYTTNRAIDFMRECGEAPWVLHLSYIKPHWPYVAPAPYHAMFSPSDIPTVNRCEAERANPHPVHAAFMQHEESLSFSRDDARGTVIPTYMGLIRQLDDHLGRLFDWMKGVGLYDNTLIVFTSDHGDYLGDHWLGETELFHEESVRVPLIIRLPGAPAGAQGQVNSRLVEAIDLAPTFVEALGGKPASHVLEGRSLIATLNGRDEKWREAAFSEADYAFRQARRDLGVAPADARAWMVRTDRWKYIHYRGFRAQLFDLESDPHEMHDLGESANYADVRAHHYGLLANWSLERKMRVTMPDEAVEQRTNTHKKRGFNYGVW